MIVENARRSQLSFCNSLSWRVCNLKGELNQLLYHAKTYGVKVLRRHVSHEIKVRNSIKDRFPSYPFCFLWGKLNPRKNYLNYFINEFLSSWRSTSCAGRPRQCWTFLLVFLVSLIDLAGILEFFICFFGRSNFFFQQQKFLFLLVFV